MLKKYHRISGISSEKELNSADLKPSTFTDDYWIYAERQKSDYPEPTRCSGKWLIFVNLDYLDDIWNRIKLATEQGRLGGFSKTGTALPNPNAQSPKLKVICVYTYDWQDEEDVRRVRQELRNLGITKKIPYKADQDTLAGKYRSTGHRRISKYYE